MRTGRIAGLFAPLRRASCEETNLELRPRASKGTKSRPLIRAQAGIQMPLARHGRPRPSRRCEDEGGLSFACAAARGLTNRALPFACTRPEVPPIAFRSGSEDAPRDRTCASIRAQLDSTADSFPSRRTLFYRRRLRGRQSSRKTAA